MKKLIVLALCALVLCAFPSFAQAEGDSSIQNVMTHHVDFFNLADSDDGVKVYDIGYSFTLFRAWNRVDFGGFGLGADAYKNGFGDVSGTMYLQMPLARVHLTDIDESEDGVVLSFGGDLVYNFYEKDITGKVGFSVTWE